MAFLSLFIPFLLFILSGIFGRKLGLKGVYFLTLFLMILLIINNLFLFYEVYLDQNFINLKLFQFILIDQFEIYLQFYFDDITVIMFIIINLISFLVLIYSYDYMINDPHIIRFFTFIFLFVFSMIFFITNSLLPLIFIGWEFVGLSSFLLISFWFTRIETNLAAIIAILMNRVGDVFFILGIFISFLFLGSLDLFVINTLPVSNLDFFILALFIAAILKSAQIPFHIWLVYSMEAPTPISSLLHAATLVTTGVILLLRLSLLLSYSYWSLIIILILGGLTCFIGASLALVSLDIKELIAYSTMSQLGYMIIIIGLKYLNLSFFHLMMHAYFKALLFLTAGSIIHTILDIQDLRKMGSLIKFLPFSYFLTIIGFTSLTGFPFSTGFYSKEIIINSSFSLNSYWSQFVYFITLFTAFITISYFYRFLLTIFFKTTRLSLFNLKNVHYYSLNLILSLILLSILTVFLGYYSFKYIYFINLPINFLFINVPLIIKLIPIIFFIFLFLIYFFLKNNLLINFPFLQNSYYYKFLYQSIVGFFIAWSYRIFFKYLDYGFWDLLSPFMGYEVYNYSKLLSNYLNLSYILSLLFYFLYLILYLF